ncbi:MAG: hypothetical protein KC646_17935 [Candidatus Cloacimonetes bacterium]|nr:hypothetical protein [Candidatus Cloacimonadota bacterium]
MKSLILLYIFILGSISHAQNIESFHANMEQSIQSEKALVGYQLDRLSKVNTKVPVHNHISNLKWLAKTQVPQYLTEKNAIKLNQGGFGTKAISSNLFHYAITMAGIGASSAIIDDYSKTGEIHLEKSLDFLSDSNFLKNSMGIFIGSTAFSVLGNFLPPGVGPILKTVPGFLGAAVGLNVASGEKINWPKVLVSSLASSAAFVALGSGGILAIGAGIAASMVSDAIFDNLTKSVGDKKELATYKPSEPLQLQNNEVPEFKDHQVNFKKSTDPKVQRQLIQEIQTSASENDNLKTKALLESLDNFGQIR